MYGKVEDRMNYVKKIKIVQSNECIYVIKTFEQGGQSSCWNHDWSIEFCCIQFIITCHTQGEVHKKLSWKKLSRLEITKTITTINIIERERQLKCMGP